MVPAVGRFRNDDLKCAGGRGVGDDPGEIASSLGQIAVDGPEYVADAQSGDFRRCPRIDPDDPHSSPPVAQIVVPRRRPDSVVGPALRQSRSQPHTGAESFREARSPERPFRVALCMRRVRGAREESLRRRSTLPFPLTATFVVGARHSRRADRTQIETRASRAIAMMAACLTNAMV